VKTDGGATTEAARLRKAWDERGRSESRDFYVASHPGWDDPAARAAQARLDATRALRGLELRLHRLHVLEIGCGVGRLASPIASRVRSYTGLDIAPSMIAEARARLAGQGGARFLECDGLGVPAAARDREYDLVLAHAVFIHCPRSVIESWIRAALEVTAPGGELRLQLRADVTDAGGLSEPVSPQAHAQAAAQRAEVKRRPAHLDLATDKDYMGHAFGWNEAREFLSQLARGALELERPDPTFFAATLRRD